MIANFYNGMGAVFVLNVLAWLESLAISLVVFGAIYGFVCAIRILFSLR